MVNCALWRDLKQFGTAEKNENKDGKWCFHRCDPGSIPGIGMWDGHVVTKSGRWVSSRYSGFLPHEDHQNANIGANEHDKYKLYNLFHNRCKIKKV